MPAKPEPKKAKVPRRRDEVGPPAADQRATRAYNSPLRDKKIEETRARIVEAISSQLTESGLKDFSVAEIAKRARVAERTVFRYFPTREDLLRSVEEEWHRKTKLDQPNQPNDLNEVVSSVAMGFRQFEANKELLEASLVSELGRNAHSWMRQRRLDATIEVMRSLLPNLDAEELRRRTYLMRNLWGFTGWRFLTRDCGLDTEAAIATTQWAMTLLLDDTRAADARAAKR